MKAPEVIRKLRRQFSDIPAGERQVLLISRLLLYHLADCSDFAQLADGHRLRDAIDFNAWLRELEAVVVMELGRDGAQNPASSVVSFPAQNICSRCGHAHKDAKECGMEMGGAGVCKCDVEVSA